MDTTALFPGARHFEQEPAAKPKVVDTSVPPRFRRAERDQVLMHACSLDNLLEEDHPARVIWAVVQNWNLSAFYNIIKAREGEAGRPPSDPKVLIALWLYAYVRGVGNGRELERLCRESTPFRWLCGGLEMCYHTLNDFRTGYVQSLDDLLTQMVTVLIDKDLVKVERISQDGVRVRASAGRRSFKTRETLEKSGEEARKHVEEVKRSAEDPSMPLKQRAAREAAAQERLNRIEQAKKELEKIEQAKARQKEKPSKQLPAKASMTDPEAQSMKMPDGGFAPAYNVQFATATQGRAVVGVEVSNAGSDANLATPMRQQVEERTGVEVKEQLVDGGYKSLEDVQKAAESGTKIYMPVPEPKKEDVDRHEPKATDSGGVAEWRQRMGTGEAKTIYRERAATSETVNAECCTYRGLGRFLVRGLEKVRCIALWSALAYNLVHFGMNLVASRV